MNNQNLPKFDSPPVIETVLSAQFSPLQNFTDIHVGWYWKNYLDPAWDQVNVVPRIDDSFEQFGGERTWRPEKSLSILTAPESNRSQIVRSDSERMIQVQNTRFIYNWRKPEDSKIGYPSYEEIVPEFSVNFSKFEDFVRDSEGTELKLNQWEVTYVNHIKKGELWDTTNDWLEIFPALSVMASDVRGQTIDNFRGFWTLNIDGNKGRLHIDMRHVRVGGASGPEVLLLQLTARGPVNEEVDLYSGFEIGHESIVLSFAEMTSTNSQKFWKRSE